MENLLRQNNIMFHEKERKIKSIIKESSNHKCIDCTKQNPEYISLNNAVFICKSCFKRHQKSPLNISKTVKNNLSDLTLKELQYLYFGGNKKMLEFMKYEYPKLIKLSPSFVYKTLAVEYYRNWLNYLIEGGVKPIKPKEEIAYKSIEDKDIIENNNLDKNKENNIITIDFYNDCYKYNDKYNRTITGFINNKEENENENLKTNDKRIKEKKIRNEKDKNNIQEVFNRKLENSSSIRNYFKIINRNNYNKYINTENINFFSFTHSNFLPQNKSEQQTKIDENYQQNFNSNISISIEKGRKNYNNKENPNSDIRPSKSNKKIYIRPKYNLYESYENSNEKDKKRNNLSLVKVKIEKEKNLKHHLIKSENLDKFKNNKIIYNNINEIKKKNNYKINNILPLKNDLKKINNGKIMQTYINFDEINNKKEKNENSGMSFSSINEKNSKNNKTIFKKKNLKNYFYIKNHQKQQGNYINNQSSDYEVIPSTNANVQLKTDYCTSNNDEDNISLNSLRTYSTNKSMKHFYKRNPRKMNRNKTNKRKKRNSKEGKIDEKYGLKTLKKEKSEILKSLKILMKKKREMEETSRKDIKKEG